MSRAKYHFSAASPKEKYVFGAASPGYPQAHITPQHVSEWISYMKSEQILRVVCLLTPNQLRRYNFLSDGLITEYKNAFSSERVLHAPVPELQLSDPETLRAILRFSDKATLSSERVVIHCLAGAGRTGHILAAWLVYKWDYSVEEALATVEDMGRQPDEAIIDGNACRDDLVELLSGCRRE